MNHHVLDRPVWSALSTRQSTCALGGVHARRFATDIGPFAGTRDDEPESLTELASLVREDGPVVLLQAVPIVLPPALHAVTMGDVVQMVAHDLAREAATIGDRDVVELTDEDIPAMLALTASTRPGPFEARTASLGTFWGVRDGTELVAMAGERMRVDGFTEVSGVCSHPRMRGRGLARMLSAIVAARIVDRGETPYLHSHASNTAAVRLYESLGFRVRSHGNVATVAAM